MTDTTRAAWWKTSTGQTWIVLGVLALAVVVGLVWNAAAQARAADVRVDRLYCSLAGVTPTARGPETGRSCADLLGE